MPSKHLKVLFVSAEVSPFAKTGGLADVAGSLPQALAAAGNDVRIVMPRYKSIKCTMNYTADFPVKVGNRIETCIVREASLPCKGCDEGLGVPVYFTDNYHYYDRESIYCHFDDADRFAFFCRAVLDMLPRINFQPDVIHCNDWHTGPICMLLREEYRKLSFYAGIASVYTIHNLEYQGNFPGDALYLFNPRTNLFTSDKVEFFGAFSFMKAGLVYADMINTVSETYAREIQTPEFGEKMDGLLTARSQDLVGIVNGISYEEFNPATDPRIFKNYDVDHPAQKYDNKKALQKEMGLPVADVPVCGLISRLTGQKGLDLIVDAAEEILSKDLQLILLGSGDKYYEDIFMGLRRKVPDKVGVYIGFNAALAQRIYAGSDMFLMPSRFEPCGLGQIIGLRYGTIPIVRAIGGLMDTVTDFDAHPDCGNGFSFTEFQPSELVDTIGRALRVYYDMKVDWQMLVLRAMSLDYSWKVPAVKYLELYGNAVARHMQNVK